MNRTQAKARAAELGISKEDARQFGNLTRTQTWLDAIAAHEAQEPTVMEVDAPVVVEFLNSPAVPDSTGIEQQPMVQHPPATQEQTVEVKSNVDTSLEGDIWSESAMRPVPIVTSASSQLAVQAAEAAAPCIPDPWDERAVQTESGQASTPTHQVESTALVYPVLLLLVLAWAFCQLLLGLGSWMTVGLTHLATEADRAVTVRRERLRTPVPQPFPSTSGSLPWIGGLRAAGAQPQG